MTQGIETAIQEVSRAILNKRSTPTGWIEPTLLNGWVNYDSAWDNVAYCLDSDGFVHVKGMIRTGTTAANTTLFTLPVGYRPARNMIFAGRMSGNLSFELRVFSTGAVLIGDSGGSATWTSFGEHTFKAVI